jgi:hypothetical protein
MTTAALLDGLTARGVTVAANGDRLKLSAPPGVLTPPTLAELKRRKPELLELLRNYEYSAPPIFAELPGVTLGTPGVWKWRQWIAPTRATLPAYAVYLAGQPTQVNSECEKQSLASKKPTNNYSAPATLRALWA